MEDEAALASWRTANRESWDESVAVHLRSDFYDVPSLRAGTARLSPIEAMEPGPVDGLDILHLQCHFGCDNLVLAQQGARVTGLDFSGAAIAAAREPAADLGLSGCAPLVEADLYTDPGRAQARVPARARSGAVAALRGAPGGPRQDVSLAGSALAAARLLALRTFRRRLNQISTCLAVRSRSTSRFGARSWPSTRQ